ncbi:hypothetical protein DACRYDRAFT_100788 [Dacryopinax primogenitus]|uniref:DUF1771-domain-containing protein n=1 Tax=Dacryopinax primogenitus (strain DJM 731) TaxID=1858805 RepID=M5FWL3_DACPD|nr:uncharacterized protein DACRYDRAFT_100788 [Dacryopinax primogenitus]EJU00774.1 hypothetical protein DACRYDRAFT_100788 [Dacryopinax primogenitus]
MIISKTVLLTWLFAAFIVSASPLLYLAPRGNWLEAGDAPALLGRAPPASGHPKSSMHASVSSTPLPAYSKKDPNPGNTPEKKSTSSVHDDTAYSKKGPNPGNTPEKSRGLIRDFFHKTFGKKSGQPTSPVHEDTDYLPAYSKEDPDPSPPYPGKKSKGIIRDFKTVLLTWLFAAFIVSASPLLYLAPRGNWLEAGDAPALLGRAPPASGHPKSSMHASVSSTPLPAYSKKDPNPGNTPEKKSTSSVHDDTAYSKKGPNPGNTPEKSRGLIRDFFHKTFGKKSGQPTSPVHEDTDYLPAYSKEDPDPSPPYPGKKSKGIIRDFFHKTFGEKASDRPWYTTHLKQLAKQHAEDGNHKLAADAHRALGDLHAKSAQDYHEQGDLEAAAQLREASKKSLQKAENADLEAKRNPAQQPISKKAEELQNQVTLGHSLEAVVEHQIKRPDYRGTTLDEAYFKKNFGKLSAAYHHV